MKHKKQPAVKARQLKARIAKREFKRWHVVKIRQDDILCLWAAVILREPEPLTRLLKKILKQPALRILNRHSERITRPAAPAARGKSR